MFRLNNGRKFERKRKREQKGGGIRKIYGRAKEEVIEKTETKRENSSQETDGSDARKGQKSEKGANMREGPKAREIRYERWGEGIGR